MGFFLFCFALAISAGLIRDISSSTNFVLHNNYFACL